MIKLKPITGWGLMGITDHGAYFMKSYLLCNLIPWTQYIDYYYDLTWNCWAVHICLYED